MGVVKRRLYYPVSTMVGVRINTDTNELQMFEPENPAIAKTEITLLKDNSEFFASDYMKNLKDDIDFSSIEFQVLDMKNSLSHFSDLRETPVTDAGTGEAMISKCNLPNCPIAYSEELKNEFERLLSPFLNVEIDKQNDILYRNSLDKIEKNSKVEFVLRGIDRFNVKLRVDSLYKNYVELRDVRVYTEALATTAIKPSDLSDTAFYFSEKSFVAPRDKDSIGGTVEYLLKLTMYGNIVNKKGTKEVK